MKTWIVGACIAALAASLTFIPSDADAKKRFGSGQNSGMQRDMPTRNAPDAPPAKPATPQPGAQPGAAVPAAAAGATAGAVAKKSSWLGPIAGIAAAVGLVALMSSLGLGGEFANFLMLALLGMAAVALVLWAMRRFGNKNGARPALATASAGAGAGAGSAASNPWSTAQAPMQRESTPVEGATAPSNLAPVASSTASGGTQPFVPAWPTTGSEVPAASVAGQPIAYERGHVPADFDTAGFERVASMIFIRMQAAYDAADLNDLRTFTTPEMFASVKMDLQDRSPAAGTPHTEVEKVQADVLDVVAEEGRQVVSVRFHGQIREDGETAPEAFDEVWHLVKPADNSRNWAIAGIQQQPLTAAATR